MHLKHAVLAAMGITTLLVSVTGYAAQNDYPTKPVRLIVPYPPGGGNDTMARAIGAKLTEAWGQQVIADNRPGANGLIACEIEARAAPDGYTVLMANIATHAISPALYKKIPFDPMKDHVPVALLGTTANVLVVPSSIPARTLRDLVNLAKEKSGQFTYGSNGVGSSQHLAGALFASTFGLNLVHVPYKGTGPMMNDLLGVQLSMSFANMVAALPHVRSGRLHGIAVTSLTRASALPDVPAVAESSPGFEATSWWGIVSTAGTPRSVIDKLNRDIVQALDTADMKQLFTRLGAEPAHTTPAQFAMFMKSELAKWTKVVKESGATAD
jgi:tripartite-type tricarboxylate transporter receptor subunit TctC